MMCDDAGIVHKAGSIFLGGPPLVKAATGETISVEDLGGATLHCSVSGCTDYFAETEQEGLEMLRDAFATLDIAPPPSRARQNNPLYDVMDLDIVCGFEDINRSRLLGVISRLVDGSRFREFKPSYGSNLVVGYSLVDQSRVGVVANCGPLTYEDGLKGAHFVQNCAQRNIPLLFLQNSGSRHAYWSSHKSCSSPEEAHHL
ncbi:UNVERIFIED_CONTAM: hypothetical protein GTU68_023427, partial [Idotea baltica]|nr:hypothetical protein [Idotea baltica]